MFSDFRIRPCEPSDCAAIAALGRSIWGDWANGRPLTHQLLDLHHPIFVADALGGDLAGYCTGIAEAYGSGAWVLSITIHPEWRRRGIGRKLVSEVVSAFRSHDAKWIGALISVDNIASQQLFSALGFALDEKVDDYYGPGEPMLKYKIAF